MKKVMTPDMVAHTWAHQLQDEAYNSGRSFYFNGKSIYSYGRHFEIARHHESGVILFTKRGYSVSTSKHISLVCRAIPHNKTVVYVPDLANSPHGNLEAWETDMKAVLKRMEKAREKEKYFNGFQKLKSEAETYIKLLKLKPSKEFKKLLNYTFEDAVKYSDELKKQQKKHLKLVQTKGKKLYEKRLDMWRNFVSIGFISEEFTYKETKLLEEYGRLFDFSRFRVSDEVETSKGVKIPIPVAQRYLKQLEEGKLTKGSQVLDFKVDEINDLGVTIGCHRFPYSEIEYLKTQIC